MIAFVEVYSGAENRTRYIANEIRNLGATVSQRFTNKVTHVIFREGLQSTIEKARARNVPCVSALWIDRLANDSYCRNNWQLLFNHNFFLFSCSKRNEKVPEDEFRICDVSESGVPIVVGRLRVLILIIFLLVFLTMFHLFTRNLSRCNPNDSTRMSYLATNE